MLLSLVDFEPSYKPLVSAAALLPMLLHWKCYWEHTRRDRYSASVVLIIGFNERYARYSWFYFMFLARRATLGLVWTDCYQSCTRRFCHNVIPVLWRYLSPTFIQVFISLTPPVQGWGGKHTRMSLYLKAAFPHFSSMLSRSRSHPEAEFWQHGLTRDSGDGQQGA